MRTATIIETGYLMAGKAIHAGLAGVGVDIVKAHQMARAGIGPNGALVIHMDVWQYDKKVGSGEPGPATDEVEVTFRGWTNAVSLDGETPVAEADDPFSVASELVRQTAAMRSQLAAGPEPMVTHNASGQVIEQPGKCKGCGVCGPLQPGFQTGRWLCVECNAVEMTGG